MSIDPEHRLAATLNAVAEQTPTRHNWDRVVAEATRASDGRQRHSGGAPALRAGGRVDTDYAQEGSATVRPLPAWHGRRTSGRAAVLVAAVVAVAGLAGALVVSGSGTARLETGAKPENPTVPVGTPQPTTSTPLPLDGSGTDSPGVGALPLVLTDLPGWELTRASDVSDPVGLVLVAEGEGLDGPVLVAQVAPSGVGMAFGEEREVTVNGATGRLSGEDDNRFLSWTDAAGTQLWLTGWQADDSTMIEAATALEVTPQGRVIVVDPPAGFVEAAPEFAESMGRFASYGFTGPSGQQAEVTLYAGGKYIQSQRLDPNEAKTITIDGEVAYLSDYGNGRYRINLVRGFWDWEIDAEPFNSQEDFVDFVSSFQTVSSATWSERLPAGIIGPQERAEAVSGMLSDMPVPTSFNIDALISKNSTLDRYQLGAEVTGAVACAWIDIWADARRSGNDVDAKLASTALTSSHEWAILQEIADQGGWSDVLWQVADEIGQTTTGTAPAEAADGSLGCRQFASYRS